ncbi:MAG: Arm DNA-binding domain-containing protein, partial [Desulfovibrio sp.]|nr:Arm DNA-binding domain-containing protein [Desulfovibrio sp.]
MDGKKTANSSNKKQEAPKKGRGRPRLAENRGKEKLTNSAIEALKSERGKDGKLQPRLLADGNGLFIIAEPSGSKRWESRVFRCGKRIRIGLGVWPEVSIKEARKRLGESRKQAREGRDPRLSGDLSFGELHERWY